MQVFYIRSQYLFIYFLFTYNSGFQCLLGGSGCIGAPSVNKSDDVSGIFAGNCVWIIEHVSIARVNVDCVIVVHG